MSQRRETQTDQLSNVIQVIQLGHKSGLLTFERGEEKTLEEGMIVFVEGQIMQARAGRFTGQSAMNRLSTWTSCRFTFVPSTPYERKTDTQSPSLDVLHQSSASSPRRTTAPLQGQKNTDTSPQPPPHLPQRTKKIEEANQLLEQAGLSRAHRRVLLLIDGQRSIADLARLAGRTQEEVQELLADLRRIGTIRLM